MVMPRQSKLQYPNSVVFVPILCLFGLPIGGHKFWWPHRFKRGTCQRYKPRPPAALAIFGREVRRPSIG